MNITDLFFPKKCLECGRAGSYICASCIAKLETLSQVCVECGRPAIDGMTHISCKRPLSLDGLIFVWPYGGVVRKAILALKYKYAKEIAEELASYCVLFLQKRKVVLPPKSTLIPIPLYWYRENWRGFNQVEEIGKLVAKDMNWDFAPDIIVRKHLKKPQAQLRKEERSKNIRGVFSLNPKIQPLIINHQSLILFDDVFTTGSTLKEATKVLKRNGVKNVWGLTIAR